MFVGLIDKFNKNFSILVENDRGRDVLMRVGGGTQFGIIGSGVGGVIGILFVRSSVSWWSFWSESSF